MVRVNEVICGPSALALTSRRKHTKSIRYYDYVHVWEWKTKNLTDSVGLQLLFHCIVMRGKLVLNTSYLQLILYLAFSGLDFLLFFLTFFHQYLGSSSLWCCAFVMSHGGRNLSPTDTSEFTWVNVLRTTTPELYYRW